MIEALRFEEVYLKEDFINVYDTAKYLGLKWMFSETIKP
jgi:hypothetical protein